MSDALLAIAEKWWTPPKDIVAKLPRGGRDPSARCNVCGGWHKQGAVHLDFVGHADLTRALIEIDPEWQWEPVAWTEEGLPRITQRGGMLVLWARVTLLGKSMLAVGTCEVTKQDADKELVGDMLRNAGMRFGIFGALWSKTDGWQDDAEPDSAPPKEGAVKPAGVASSATGSMPMPDPYEAAKAATNLPGAVTLPPVVISQPDKPLVAMTMRELLEFATTNGITVSGTKSDIVRTLEPLVRAASGEEPFLESGVDGADAANSYAARPDPEQIEFAPVVAGSADADMRRMKPDARASVRRGGE